MRKKEFVCKLTAAFLSAAMVFTCIPMNGQVRVNASETERDLNVFQFGSARTELSADEYSLPVALMKSTAPTEASMAGSCIKNGKLTVNSDGTADITVYLQAVTVGSVSSWASDWMIYEEDLDGEKTAAVYTQNGEGNVESITFRLPKNDMDGVYVEMSANNYTQKGYLAFDFAAIGGEATAEKKSGSAKVEQFGGYDVNVGVSVQAGRITDLEVAGANFDGTFAAANQAKLQDAADKLKASYIGKSATDVKELEGIDAVSGATYSSKAIQSAVLNALELEPSDEAITLPTEELEEGTYQVDIAFYTDGVKHSLIENDKAKATITVDDEGNMTLTTAVVNGTEKEPLYIYAFNGYYKANDVNNALQTTDKVKKEDIDFTDDVFGGEEKVVTEVSFPLEGDFSEIYYTNASIYVPAMKNLTGDLAGITFEQGRFTTDCLAKIYWDSLKKTETGSGFGSKGIELEAGVYTLPVAMKNAEDHTANSMASSCLQGAAMTVKSDGSAVVTLDLTAVTVTTGTVTTVTAWASDWKIYQEQSVDSETVNAVVTKTDEDGNVTQIAFTIPDRSEDGVYVSMSAMGGRIMQAYLAFDFENAIEKKASLENGIYVVEGEMYKPGLVEKSMADTAFHHNIMMTVKDGTATLTMNFKGMEITGLKGYLGSLKYYDTGYGQDAYGNPTGTLKDVTVESVQKYSDGVVISDDFGTDYPDVISFEVISEAMEDGIVPLQVFVPIMESITAGTGNQNVYLKLDLSSLKETTAEDDLFKETEEAPQNPNPSKPGPLPGGSKDQTDSVLQAGQTVNVSGHTYKVTANGEVAFAACKKNAKSVKVPEAITTNGVSYKVTSIAKNAMKNNKKLKKVTLGKNVSKVGKNAFKGCKKLKTVKLPKGLAKKKKNTLKKQIKNAGISSKVSVK